MNDTVLFVAGDQWSPLRNAVHTANKGHALRVLCKPYAPINHTMENAKSPRSFSILHFPFSITPPLRKSSHSGQNKCGDENETQTPAVFALGAAGYAALELLWRGRTHWTMALTGGAVLVGLRQLRRRVHEESPLSRCLCGAACITAAEYVVGCTVNRHFRLRVWGLLARIRQCSRGRSARNTPCCGRCSPRRSCCRNRTKICASPLAIRFSMAYNSDKLCRKGDTPC